MADPSPQFDLAVAGDECDSCRAFWTGQGKKPRRLVLIHKETAKHKIPIVCCPYCDGAPIIEANRP